MYWLIELSLTQGLLSFIAIMVVLGGVIFTTVHHYFVKQVYQKIHYQISKMLFRTVASLLALMLSFTYANQRIDYITVKNSIQAEASKVVSIHMNLEMYHTPQSEILQKELRSYVKIMTEEGWKPIKEDPFRSKTFLKFREINKGIVNLETNNQMQENVKRQLVQDVDEMSDYLQVRFYKTRPETPFLFYVACFGFVVVMILYSTYPPDRISIIFISLYNMFIALVLYFILMMNNPFVGPLQVKADAFQILRETIDRGVEE